MFGEPKKFFHVSFFTVVFPENFGWILVFHVFMAQLTNGCPRIYEGSGMVRFISFWQNNSPSKRFNSRVLNFGPTTEIFLKDHYHIFLFSFHSVCRILTFLRVQELVCWLFYQPDGWTSPAKVKSVLCCFSRLKCCSWNKLRFSSKLLSVTDV